MSAAVTGKSVLIVEDEALILFATSDELTAVGYTVYEASDADAAASASLAS